MSLDKNGVLFSVYGVRLGGYKSSASEGYVEVKASNGSWGGVCKSFFDLKDANVVCRMLGFPVALATGNLYGIGKTIF